MEQESQKRKLDETSCEPLNEPLLCVNNCGFFGTPQNNNLCSKCYRELLSMQSKALIDETKLISVETKVGDEEIVVNSAEDVKQQSGVKEETSETMEKRPANRCSFCRKRVGLMGFKCRCGQTFCSIHRYADKHDCAFDYKTAGQQAIANSNPVVKADKVEKI